MTVIYADSVFFLNMAMDYVLFLGTARLAGLTLQRKRYVLAAVLGGLYAVAVFLPRMEFLGAMPVKLSVGVVLCQIAFGREQKLLRLILLFSGISCAMAGGVLGLGLMTGSNVPMAGGIFFTDVDAYVLLVAATTAYLLLTVVFRAAAKHAAAGELVTAGVCLKNKETELTALWDSGNTLRDGVSGQFVLVVAPAAIDTILPSQVRMVLRKGDLRFPETLLAPMRLTAPELRPRLIPYRAVGVSGGLLLTITADSVKIGGETYAGVPVALSPTVLGEGYSALWGGEVKRGGCFGNRKNLEVAANTDRCSAGGGSPLYRRKRHPSGAADERAGSGAAGTAAGGIGAERTH